MNAHSEIQPLRVTSVKDACSRFLEGKILSGEWHIGARLLSERSLAASLQVSRLLLHEAIVELAAKGLVEIVPRRGVFVSDYLQNGSCNLLYTLMAYQNGELDRDLLESLMGMRMLFETETARLAALLRQDAHLEQMRAIVKKEEQIKRIDINALTELDFAFHQKVALASGNLIYPMIINSFKNVYTNLTGRFFRSYQNHPAVDEVIAFHKLLTSRIAAHERDAASEVMRDMLAHGASYLLLTFNPTGEKNASEN